ncbi:MAG: GTP cyclohydrolase I FolE [Prevotellaceae bacterium]|nr:GTP cyclohydrolase I FolE [Candidatus Minthosoma caballi]
MNKEEKIESLKSTCRKQLEIIGEDIQREGLQKTPDRVAKAFIELTRGYEEDPVATLKSAIFNEDYNQMVLVKGIEFYSLCEHHILPFFGKVHVAYIPNGTIVGLSKIPRVVDIFSHRLQVQEHLTKQICDSIQQALNPLGAIVVIEAQHLCMQMRGIEKQGATTTTIYYTGVFEQNEKRQEFLDLI